MAGSDSLRTYLLMKGAQRMNITHFAPKHCEKILSHLDAYLSRELRSEIHHEVRLHLAECPGCAEEFATRAGVRNLLQRAVRRDAAPAALPESIQRKIRSTSSWGHWWLAAAAALLLTLSVWGALEWRNARDAASTRGLTASLLRVGLGDHIHCAVEAGFANRAFAFEQMAEKMGPEYSGLVPQIKARAPATYEVTVGHRCRANGRQFVHLILKNQTTMLSVVITPKQGESFAANDLAATATVSGVPLYQARLDGFEVAGFETRDHLAYVISDLTQGDHREIASSLSPPMRDFLRALESRAAYRNDAASLARHA
jgi:anti-sigma factor (TIGR02949 family)